MKTILCMKWGTQYGPEFVNQLYNGVMANCTDKVRFICLTDDGTGLIDGIEALPLPDITLGSTYLESGWRKLSSLSPQLKEAPYNLSGTILFFDIDMIVTDNIDGFWDYKPGEFCIIENWTQKGRGIGNSSVYRYELEQMHGIFHDFEANHNKMFNIGQMHGANHLKSTVCPIAFFVRLSRPKCQMNVKSWSFTARPNPWMPQLANG
jgi:hypothetical protein